MLVVCPTILPLTTSECLNWERSGMIGPVFDSDRALYRQRSLNVDGGYEI